MSGVRSTATLVDTEIRERKRLLSFLIFLDPSPGLLSVDIFSIENRTLSDMKYM